MRRLALLLVVALAVAPTAALVLVPALDRPALAVPGGVSYKPPVDGPIVDPWRRPSEPWAAGNRGVDYATGPGEPVRSAADGEVVFAGPVAEGLHVVVLHPDGIRTTYAFLQSIAVHRGDTVRQGQTVGTSAGTFHFGARVGDSYIDPTTLFDGGPPHVYLVPDDARRPESEAKERSALSRFLGGVRRVGGAALGAGADAGRWAAGVAVDQVAARVDELRGVVHWGRERLPITHAMRFGHTALAWWRQRGDCTPSNVQPPPLAERRIVVLVGGVGSHPGDGLQEQVDPEALGFATDDVRRFSYDGPTTVDIRDSVRRLGDLLEQVARVNPGVPVDIIGHSQGGILARSFLAYEYDADDPDLPRVAHLVTLASPHQGADLATGLGMVAHTTSGDLLERAIGASGLAPFDPQGVSVGQLSETSEFLRRLNRRPLPAGVRATSIGGRGDLTVPAIHTNLDGARNVVVSPPGALSDHRSLPGTDAARREVGLALADMAPTCQSLADMLTDTLVSDVITVAEDAAGASLWAAGHWVDGRLQSATIPRERNRR